MPSNIESVTTQRRSGIRRTAARLAYGGSASSLALSRRYRRSAPSLSRGSSSVTRGWQRNKSRKKHA